LFGEEGGIGERGMSRRRGDEGICELEGKGIGTGPSGGRKESSSERKGRGGKKSGLALGCLKPWANRDCTGQGEEKKPQVNSGNPKLHSKQKNREWRPSQKQLRGCGGKRMSPETIRQPSQGEDN